MLLGVRRSYLGGLHGSWPMGIALFVMTFLRALVAKHGGRLLRLSEQGG